MDEQRKPRYAEKRITKTVEAFRTARIWKGLSRKDAAVLCNCSPKSFEQLENGRVDFTEARLSRLLALMGVELFEFESIKDDPKRYLALANEAGESKIVLGKKPRRNTYKLIKKETRVIRMLRLRKGFSQYQASRLCGYAKCEFGHIERGRIKLSPSRIQHILQKFAYSLEEFQELVAAPILRDEIITEAIAALYRLDDQALLSAANIIKALNK